MKTISREVLDFYIYDLGYDEALEYFKITDRKAQSILFDQPLPQVRYNGINKAYLEEGVEVVCNSELSPTRIEEIEKEYVEIYNRYTKYPNNKIDSRAKTKIDRLHDVFLKMYELNTIANTNYVNFKIAHVEMNDYKHDIIRNKYLDNYTEFESNNIDEWASEYDIELLKAFLKNNE